MTLDVNNFPSPSGANVSPAPFRTALHDGAYVTPEDYFGSGGSITTTTGGITAATAALTLAAASDFANGQGVLVVGAGVAQTGVAPTGLTVTPTLATGATTWAYRISTDDGNGGLSAAIAAVSIANGVATLSTAQYNALAWVAGAGAVRYHIWVSKSGAAYVYIGSTALTSFNDCGATYTLPSTPAKTPFWVPALPNALAQADFFVTTISSGAGTTALTLAANATTTVAGAFVQHDDTAAIQAAVTATATGASIPYIGGSTFPSYQVKAIQLADGALYNISSAINVVIGATSWFARGNATIAMAGYNANTITSTNLNRIDFQNITFAGGAHAVSISQAAPTNRDDTIYRFDHCEFIGQTDYAIVTTNDFSAAMHCYACNWVGCNGAISSDADRLTIQGGWSETSYLWFQLNRSWFKQSHTSYYNQIWGATDHTAVPVQFDGIIYTQGNRWFDVQGTLQTRGCRFGGENAGIPAAYIQSTISTAISPLQYQGPAVDIQGGWAFGGPTSGMTVTGAIVLNGVPASIVFNSMLGPSTTNIVTDNIGGGFTAAVNTWKAGAVSGPITDATQYLKYNIDLGGSRVVTPWPSALAPFITSFQRMVYAPEFGTGSDGDVTITSGTTTLTREMNYRNLTISGTGHLNASTGHWVKVRDVLDISAAPAGAIFVQVGTAVYNPTGSNASGATGGTSSSIFSSRSDAPYSDGGVSGKTGGTGVGTAGAQGAATQQWMLGGRGGAAGAGGASGTPNAGGALAAIRAAAGFASNLSLTPIDPKFTYYLSSTPATISTATGGAVGGAGGGDGTNAGGGSGASGAGGGPLRIAAGAINRGGSTAASAIAALGENAGTSAAGVAGTAGGGGGSGGGGGGWLHLVVGTLIGSTATNALDVSGGNGAAGGNGLSTGKGGNGGDGGNAGSIDIINLAAGTYTHPITGDATGGAGGTTANATGGTAGTGANGKANL